MKDYKDKELVPKLIFFKIPQKLLGNRQRCKLFAERNLCVVSFPISFQEFCKNLINKIFCRTRPGCYESNVHHKLFPVTIGKIPVQLFFKCVSYISLF